MFHREEVSLTISGEQAQVLNTALECYKLWLEAHPHERELRQDLPLVEELLKEVQQRIAAQSPDPGNWTALYGRTRL